ncbi:hypothetical protein [Sphingomonas sp. Leaf62]|uniref:hypothetical protein n=1 Tax=Sphingomonas sp. Leaf62 TaxID=1736228 RepID=UPI000B1C99F8|nr:hypothetical protein [Sphingomonas sp. Leaf62]
MYKRMIVAMVGLGLAGPAFAQYSNPVNDRYAGSFPALSSGQLDHLIYYPGYGGMTPTMKRQRTAQVLRLRDFVEQRTAENGGALTEADHQEISRRYRRIIGVR